MSIGIRSSARTSDGSIHGLPPVAMVYAWYCSSTVPARQMLEPHVHAPAHQIITGELVAPRIPDGSGVSRLQGVAHKV